MQWKGRRQSDNVEDRRTTGGGFSTGPSRMPGMRSGAPVKLSGGSIVGLLVMMGILWMLGINPMTLLEGGAPATQSQSFGEERPRSAAEEELAAFVKVVLAETEDTWGRIFADAGETYPEPRLVLFTGQTNSACGFASAASGPFYCPGDSKVYIDLGFYEELRRKFEAPGDFAQAYVIAHEVGHHVQNVIGVLPEFNRQRQSMSEREANAMSVRVELQADCLAGVWAADAERKGLLERGDIQEALNAATQIGDDTLQKRMQGYVVPESFNHGTSEQRRRWFGVGLDTGDFEACDTFNTDSL